MSHAELSRQIEEQWPGQTQVRRLVANATTEEVACGRALLAELCRHLAHQWGYCFAGLIVEEG